MEKLSLQEQITRLAEPLLDSLGLDLWGLEYLPSTGRAIVRIYIERKASCAAEVKAGVTADCASAAEPVYPEDIDLDAAEEFSAQETDPLAAGIDECTRASRLIGLTLEVEDLIPSAYVLEVSTPGLERRFFKPAQLAANQGKLVDIQLENPVSSHPFRKKFTGTLTSASLKNDSWGYTLDLHEPGPDDEPQVAFGWENVKKARRMYIEEPKEKPGKKGVSSKNGKNGKESKTKQNTTGKPDKKSGKSSAQGKRGRQDELD